LPERLRQFQKNKIPKTTTLLYAYKYYVTNYLLTQSRRAAENERRLIKGVGILIFWSYLRDGKHRVSTIPKLNFLSQQLFTSRRIPKKRVIISLGCRKINFALQEYGKFCLKIAPSRFILMTFQNAPELRFLIRCTVVLHHSPLEESKK